MFEILIPVHIVMLNIVCYNSNRKSKPEVLIL